MSHQKLPPIRVKTELGLPTIKIKTEPGTIDGERLSSFKLPRDLTLGGLAHKTKKTFTPNLNIVRNKHKSVEPSTPSTSGRNVRGRGRGDGRGRGTDGRGRGRGKEFIQSQGVFSEGIANSRKKASWGSSGPRDDTPSSMEKPKVDFKKDVKVDKDEEDKKLSDIFEDKGDYSSLEPDYDFGPIKLPYRVPGMPSLEHCANLLPLKIKIKQENETDIKDTTNVLCGLRKIKQEHMGPINNIMDLLNSENQKLIFFQFPESLPGFGTAPEPEPIPKGQRLPVSNETETKEESHRCTLKDLDEGLIGKLVIYKSGKVKLFMGSTPFNVQLGLQRSFLQDVISVDTSSDRNEGKMINLGHVEGGLVITPDWNYLLNV